MLYDYKLKRLKKEYLKVRNSNLSEDKKKQAYSQINEQIKALKKTLVKSKKKVIKEPKNEFMRQRKEYEDR